MSVEESEYLEMVTSLYSIPFTIAISGNVHRPDFLYTDTRTGVPLLYRWDKGESQCITPGDEPVMGCAALHNTKPWIVFAKDVGGTEDYAIYFADYSLNKITQITKGTIGRLTELFWASDSRWVVIGCDKQEYYVTILSRDGSRKNVFTTDQQIAAAAYDDQRGLVAAAVGRGPGTKLAIIDVQKGNVEWISESDESEDTFPFVYSEKGYLGYTTDVSGKTEIVVRSIETLKGLNRFSVPGDIGILPGMGNVTWIDDDTIFVGVAKDAQVSPRLLTIPDGKWSDPLADISVLLSTCTKDGPVWIGSSFSQPLCVQTLKNGKVITLIQPEYTGEYVSGESHWYTSFDGRKIQGWLLRNPNPEALLLISCHGGPNFATLNMWAQGVHRCWPGFTSL